MAHDRLFDYQGILFAACSNQTGIMNSRDGIRDETDS